MCIRDSVHAAAAVVAHVDYQPVGGRQIRQDIVEIAVAHAIGETRIIHVSDILLQNAVGDAAGVAVVEVEIIFLDYAQLKILRIVAPPLFVIGGGERCRQVGVAVAKFVEHLRAHVEQLLLSHGG